MKMTIPGGKDQSHDAAMQKAAKHSTYSPQGAIQNAPQPFGQDRGVAKATYATHQNAFAPQPFNTGAKGPKMNRKPPVKSKGEPKPFNTGHA